MTEESVLLLVPLRLQQENIANAVRLLFHHPSAVLKTLAGNSGQKPEKQIYQVLRQEYAKHARTAFHLKRTLGFYIYLNPDDLAISPIIAKMGWFEFGTTGVFLRLLSKGHTVVDVGSNIGWFTLLAATVVGKNGLVISFEPEPTSFSLLARSVARNRFGNVKLVRKSVSNIDGEEILYLSHSENRGIHSTVRDLGGPAIVVPSTKLDSYASDLRINEIHLLKVDAEGAEAKVLAGAQGLVAKGAVKHMIVEWNPESWVGQRRLLDTILSSFDAYELSRSKPFFIFLRRLSAESLPKSYARAILFTRKT